MEPNQKIVATFLELFSAGELDDAFAMMAGDGRWVVPGRSPIATDMSGQDFRKQIDGFMALMPSGFVIRPTGWTIAGDRVAVQAVSEAEIVNGKKYENQYHFLFELADGEIQKVTEYACSYHVLDVFKDFLAGQSPGGL